MMLLSYTHFWYMLLGSVFHTTEVCNSKLKGLCHEEESNFLNKYTDIGLNKSRGRF